MAAPIPLTTIPFDLWCFMVIIGMLCMVYSLLRTDMENYTHIVAGVFATIMFFITGLYAVMGIVTTAGSSTATFRASWLMLLCFAVGVYMALLTFMRIIDLTKVTNYTDGSTTALNPVRGIRKL